jgi:YD repeat-containing protein
LLFLFGLLSLLASLPSVAAEPTSCRLQPWHQYEPKTRTETWNVTHEKKVEWIYDARGNRIEWRDWAGTSRYSFDTSHNMIEAVSPQGEKTCYQYDARDRPSKITYQFIPISI